MGAPKGFKSQQTKNNKVADYFKNDNGKKLASWLKSGNESTLAQELIHNTLGMLNSGVYALSDHVIGYSERDKTLSKKYRDNPTPAHLLHHAIELGKTSVAETIASDSSLYKRLHIDVGYADPVTGNNALHLAAQAGAFDVIHALRKHHPRTFKNLVNEKNALGQTPLDIVLNKTRGEDFDFNAQKALVQELLKGNANTLAPYSPGYKEFTEKLVEVREDASHNPIPISREDKKLLSHILISDNIVPAAQKRKTQVIPGSSKSVVQLDPHYDFVINNGRTVLHQKAIEGDAAQTEYYAKQNGGQLVTREDSQGNSPLHLALEAAALNLGTGATTALINAGAVANTVNKAQQTPLHIFIATAVAAVDIPNTVNELMKHDTVKASVGTRDQNGDTALHLAVQHHNADVAGAITSNLNKKHADNGKLAVTENNAGKTPVELALEKGDIQSFEHLYFAGGAKHITIDNPKPGVVDGQSTIDISYNPNGSLDVPAKEFTVTLPTAEAQKLHDIQELVFKQGVVTAAKEGRYDDMAALLEKGANPDAVDLVTGKTALHFVIGDDTITDELKAMALTSKLLQSGARTNIADIDGNQALHIAARRTKFGSLPEKLLNNEADAGKSANPNATNNAGDTPLHIAARLLDCNALDPLFRHAGTQVNVQDANGHTAADIVLEGAFASDNIENLKKVTREIQTPSAVHPDGVVAFNHVDLNANVPGRDSNYLDCAIEDQKTGCFLQFFQLGITPTKDLNTLFSRALDDIDVNIANRDHANYINGLYRLMKEWKTKDASQNFPAMDRPKTDIDADRNTLFHRLAANGGSKGYIRPYTFMGVKNNARNSLYQHYVHIAAAHQTDDFIVTAKEDLGEFWQAPVISDSDMQRMEAAGVTFIEPTLGPKFPILTKENVEKLQASGASLDSFEGSLDNVLHIAIRANRPVNVLDKILEGASNNEKSKRRLTDFVNAPNKDGKSPVHLAIDTNNIDAFKALLAAGGAINVYKQRDDTKAFVATPGELDDVSKALIDGLNPASKAAFEKAYDEHILFMAASSEFEIDLPLRQRCQTILDKGQVDLTRTYQNNQTIAHVATLYGHAGFIEMLKASDPHILTYVDRDNIDPVYYAFSNCPRGVEAGNAARLQLLSHADIAVRFDQNFSQGTAGASILHRASQNHCSLEVLNKLLERADVKAEINRKDGNGKTPLHAAIIDGNLDKAKALITNGANPFLKDNDGRDAFGQATTSNRPAIKAYLDTLELVLGKDRIVQLKAAARVKPPKDAEPEVAADIHEEEVKHEAALPSQMRPRPHTVYADSVIETLSQTTDFTSRSTHGEKTHHTSKTAEAVLCKVVTGSVNLADETWKKDVNRQSIQVFLDLNGTRAELPLVTSVNYLGLAQYLHDQHPESSTYRDVARKAKSLQQNITVRGATVDIHAAAIDLASKSGHDASQIEAGLLQEREKQVKGSLLNYTDQTAKEKTVDAIINLLQETTYSKGDGSSKQKPYSTEEIKARLYSEVVGEYVSNAPQNNTWKASVTPQMIKSFVNSRHTGINVTGLHAVLDEAYPGKAPPLEAFGNLPESAAKELLVKHLGTARQLQQEVHVDRSIEASSSHRTTVAPAPVTEQRSGGIPRGTVPSRAHLDAKRPVPERPPVVVDSEAGKEKLPESARALPGMVGGQKPPLRPSRKAPVPVGNGKHTGALVTQAYDLPTVVKTLVERLEFNEPTESKQREVIKRLKDAVEYRLKTYGYEGKIDSQVISKNLTKDDIAMVVNADNVFVCPAKKSAESGVVSNRPSDKQALVNHVDRASRIDPSKQSGLGY